MHTTPLVDRLRPYTPDDLGELVRLLLEAGALPPTASSSADDLLWRWKRRGVRPEEATRILPAASGGIIAAMQEAILAVPSRLAFEIAVHPDYRRQGIGTALFQLAEERARHERVEYMSASVYVAEGDTSEHVGTRFLQRAGFVPHHSHWQMRIENLRQQTAPFWPPGITWRRFGAVQTDASRWAELVRATFGEAASAESVAAQLAEPGTSPEGYFFAVEEATGREIGTTRTRMDVQGGRPTGYLGTVGVLSEYRRRGIGEALVLHALTYLAERGADAATLLVESDNHRARRLYERLGWRRVYRTDQYWKPVRM